MADLVEGTYATGAGVFHPGCNFMPDPNLSSDDGAGEDNTIMIDSMLLQGTGQSISFAAAAPVISAPTPAVPTTIAATVATASLPINATTSQPLASHNALSCKHDATGSDELTSTKCQQGHG